MAALLAVTLVMAVGMVISDQGKRATFNVHITLVTVCSVWMAWRSIEDRDNVDRYRGFTCKLPERAARWLCAVPAARHRAQVEPIAVKVMVIAFALLGLVTCGTLLLPHRSRCRPRKQWWLSDHLTAMALNFGATHASMTILGLSSLVARGARTSDAHGDPDRVDVCRARGTTVGGPALSQAHTHQRCHGGSMIKQHAGGLQGRTGLKLNAAAGRMRAHC